jgi:hypothetical protein
MAIAQTTTTSFRVELLQAVHNFDSDTFYIALYTGAADIGPTTTEYTSTGEASGTGYDAGGQEVTVSVTPTSANNSYGIPTAYISFANVSWESASFTARGALIYNTTQGNKSVAVLDFGGDKTVTDGTFAVQFPTADANSAIVRIS